MKRIDCRYPFYTSIEPITDLGLLWNTNRAALGIDKSTDILEHIRSLPTPEEQTAAMEKIQAIEREAMLAQQPQPGLVELIDYLERRGVRRALCTRNFE